MFNISLIKKIVNKGYFKMFWFLNLNLLYHNLFVPN